MSVEDKECFGAPRKAECKTCFLVRECVNEVKLRSLGVKATRIRDGRVE